MGGQNFVTLGAIPDPQNDLVTTGSVSIAATGTVIPGVAGKRISVHAVWLQAAATATFIPQGTVNLLSGTIAMSSGNPVVLPWSSYPWWSVGVGDSLIFTFGTAGQISGRILYVQG